MLATLADREFSVSSYLFTVSILTQLFSRDPPDPWLVEARDAHYCVNVYKNFNRANGGSGCGYEKLTDMSISDEQYDASRTKLGNELPTITACSCS